MPKNRGAQTCNRYRLVVLLLLCAIPATIQYKRLEHRQKPAQIRHSKRVIYALNGEVKRPGIYRYEEEQTPAALAKACGAPYNAKHTTEGTIASATSLLFGQSTTVLRDMDAAVLMSYFQPLSLATASAEDFEMIPGIGPKTARALFDYLEQAGPVTNIDQLINVRGIGPKTLKKIKRYLKP